MLCIFGFHLFFPIPWMRMKQSQNSASSEIISPGRWFTSGTILGMCFGIIHRQNRQSKLSDQRRHDKERSSRCPHQTHSRKYTAPSPHYIQLHFVKNDREINHKCGGLHKLSVSIASIPSNVVPTFPHNRWPQTSSTIVSKLATARWSFRSGPLGIKKRKNKRVGPNIGWPYPGISTSWRSFYSTHQTNTKNKKIGTYWTWENHTSVF